MTEMLEDEDDNLVALRRAALASIQAKRKGEDLSDLRNAALNTRKQFDNEEGTYVFQKVDPPKVSNLISISTQPPDEVLKNKPRDKFNRNVSESESSEYERDGGSTSSYYGSSSSSEEESNSESENKKQPEKPKEEKKKSDDDDILNAIEEFLNEGNEIEEKDEKKEQVKKEKKKKERRKKVKRSRLNTEQRKEHKPVRMIDDHNAIKTEKDRRHLNKDAVAKSKQRVEQNHRKRERIPLQNSRNNDYERTNRRPKEDDLNSVHSSDLSFIEDLSDQEKNSRRSLSPVEMKPLPSKVNGSTNTGRNKVDETKTPPLQKTGTKINLSHIKAPAFDLRNKLKTKGLHNKSKQQNNNGENKTNDNSKETLSPNIKVKIKKKIYVKPGFVSGDADVLKFQKQKKTIKLNQENISWKEEDASKIVITRGVSDKGFTPISVRLKDSLDDGSEAEMKPAKVRRGRRSVVQFSPNTTVTEKKEKIEDLMKKGAERRKEDLSYSDMSDHDFEEFEIEDEVGIFEVEDDLQHPQDLILNPDTNSTYPEIDTRHFVRKSSASSESGQDILELHSIADESKREISPKRVRVTAERHLPRVGAAEPRRRRRSRSADFDRENADALPNNRLQRKARPFSAISSHISLPRNNSDAIRRGDVRRRVGVTTRTRGDGPGVRNSRASYKRDLYSIKSRLGSDFPLITREMSPSPPRRKKRRGDDSPPRRPLKEEEVDARIRRINQQNAAILKRRREVEEEEKRFC